MDPRLEINRVQASNSRGQLLCTQIEIHQYSLAGSFYKTDLISHNMYK